MKSGYAGGDPKNTKVRLKGGSAVLNVIAVFVVIVMVSAAVFYFFGDRIMELIFPPAPVKITAVDIPTPYQLPTENVEPTEEEPVAEGEEAASEVVEATPEEAEVVEVTPEVVEEPIVEAPVLEPMEVVVIEPAPAAARAPEPVPARVVEAPVAEAPVVEAPVIEAPVVAEVTPEAPVEEETPVEEEYAEETIEDEYVEETPVVVVAPVAPATPAPAAPAPRASASVAVTAPVPLVSPSVSASPAAPSAPTAVASAPVSRPAQPHNAKSQYAVYITLAKAALDEDNEKEAQRNFLKAYLLIPNSEVAYNIAIIYLQRNLPDRAVAWIRRVELDEHDAGDLIIAMVNAGHKRAASAALSHLISQDKEGYIYYSSAYLKEFNGNIEGAAGDYKTAMQRSGYDDYITYAYARSLDQLGQISEARSYYASVASSANRDLSSAAAQRLETLR
jgi:hypothetical protein